MKITDQGKLNSLKGFANERRLLASLLERGYNASIVDLPHSSYDIVVETDIGIIRLQVKTVSSKGTIKFTGGTRGGQDREYISDIKEYTQNTETSDAVVGVQSIINNGDTSIDYWFIPTCYVEHISQKSLSVNKASSAKNNWELMEKCKNIDFVMSILKPSKNVIK